MAFAITSFSSLIDGNYFGPAPAMNKTSQIKNQTVISAGIKEMTEPICQEVACNAGRVKIAETTDLGSNT